MALSKISLTTVPNLNARSESAVIAVLPDFPKAAFTSNLSLVDQHSGSSCIEGLGTRPSSAFRHTKHNRLRVCDTQRRKVKIKDEKEARVWEQKTQVYVLCCCC